MTFSFLLFIARKPSLSPAEFKTYWDTKHVELLKSIMGENFPLTHTCHYIARPAKANVSWPATVLVGAREDFTYDGIVELVFPDKSAFQTSFGIYSVSEAVAGILEDEEAFIDREKMKAMVLGETSVTSKH